MPGNGAVRLVLFEGVENVLFQALLLDEVEMEHASHELSASLHTIYCLNKRG